VDEHPIDAGVVMLDDDVPPGVEGNSDDRGAQSLDRRELRLWRVLGNDDRTRYAEAPRVPRDP